MSSLYSAFAAATGPVGGHKIHSEADLILPNLHNGHHGPNSGVADHAGGVVKFLGLSGWTVLAMGLIVCALAIVFGMVIYRQLKNMPVHKSMKEVSELIYETCKTYLQTQGKFIALLWLFVGTIIIVYFGVLEKNPDTGLAVPPAKVAAIAGFSIIGILGSYGVAWFGIRVNTFANSRAAFASLRGKPYPTYAIPLKAGMSIGTMLIAIELLLMLAIMLFLPGDYAGPCFIGFAVGESLGAAALRIAGGIFTKIADIGSDLMKIVFNIKEDDARNPGVIADCTGDNAGDSVGPTADGFETYGVTGVALITFILIALSQVTELQTILLVWLFSMRIAMVVAAIGSYLLNEYVLTKPKYQHADKMDFEHPLTVLVWLTSIVAVGLTFLISYFLIGPGAGKEFALGGAEVGTYLGFGLWWKLSVIISCGTLAGAIIPETVKVFTSTRSAHVKEVVQASRQGGASLNVLAGLTAGNFSAYWMGIAIVSLMGIAYGVSTTAGLEELITAGSHGQIAGFAAEAASAVFAFGLVAFGFLGMGPVTIAVDSYGPVTDNAQSVYELSVIETIPGISEEIKKDFGFTPNFELGKHFLEENDGAGNTFKATAKPVLIGTAVVGATTMIFAIIMLLTDGLQADKIRNLSMLHPPFLLGLITGGAVIYWFTGASTQAVSTGAYRAVEFIKANIKLDDGATKASIEDSKKVVEICTKYAQKGMVNIFFVLFFSTLAFACLEPYFFIGYLISMALFGLYQAIFMANAGGAWDNAKKVVEVELKEKGTALHAAVIVGDTVGDHFKDTSSVALNPVIKFTTLFGVLAVGLSLKLDPMTNHVIAAVGFVISAFFVWRSFYGMRIDSGQKS